MVKFYTLKVNCIKTISQKKNTNLKKIDFPKTIPFLIIYPKYYEK